MLVIPFIGFDLDRVQGPTFFSKSSREICVYITCQKQRIMEVCTCPAMTIPDWLTGFLENSTYSGIFSYCSCLIHSQIWWAGGLRMRDYARFLIVYISLQILLMRDWTSWCSVKAAWFLCLKMLNIFPSTISSYVWSLLLHVEDSRSGWYESLWVTLPVCYRKLLDNNVHTTSRVPFPSKSYTFSWIFPLNHDLPWYKRPILDIVWPEDESPYSWDSLLWGQSAKLYA